MVVTILSSARNNTTHIPSLNKDSPSMRASCLCGRPTLVSILITAIGSVGATIAPNKKHVHISNSKPSQPESIYSHHHTTLIDITVPITANAIIVRLFSLSSFAEKFIAQTNSKIHKMSSSAISERSIPFKRSIHSGESTPICVSQDTINVNIIAPNVRTILFGASIV